MYNQPEDIIGQYELTAGQIMKGRGGSYICETDYGTKVLVSYAGSKERARFLREYLIYLKDAGFSCEQILLTKAGEAVCEDAFGERFLCKDMVAGSECSTKNRDEMKQAAKILAFYHKVSARCMLEIPQKMQDYKMNPAEICHKRTKEMLKVRNYIRDKRRKDEFEIHFLQQYPHFAAQAAQAEELLDQKPPKRILVHGDIDQHNIKKTPDGWRIVNFEHLEYSWRMGDLAGFLRKMMEKNNWRMDLGYELIEAYDSVERIRPSDKRLLYVLLCYPEKFWKLANRYKSSHKAWLSGRSLEKLDRLAALEGARESFLNSYNL